MGIPSSMKRLPGFMLVGGAFCSPLLCFLLAGAQRGPLLSIKRLQLLPLWLWSACPSLWSLGPHFPVAAWETSLSCSRVRKAQVWQRTSLCCPVFEDGLKTRTPLPLLRRARGILLPRPQLPAPRGGRESPSNWPRCTLHIATQCQRPLLPERKGKKRREMNSQDRAGLKVYL